MLDIKAVLRRNVPFGLEKNFNPLGGIRGKIIDVASIRDLSCKNVAQN